MGKRGGGRSAMAAGSSVALFLCSAILVWYSYHGQPWLLRGFPQRVGNAGISTRARVQIPRINESTGNVTSGNDHNVTTAASAAAAGSAALGAIRTAHLRAHADPSAPGFEHRMGRVSATGEGKEPRVSRAECDVFAGRWVYDESYVFYQAGPCPYASSDFNCRANGRTDFRYERWRWQPRGCDIPRFNASRLLERLRGKRLLYVGDSINRNQWESMVCLLRAAVPEGGGSLRTANAGKSIAYVIKACNCSVELSWAPFLVRQSQVAASGQAPARETLRIDAMDEQADRWRHADVLVFNTGHWWTHEEPYRGVDYFEEGGHVHSHMEEAVAFKSALRTWARWVDNNIDPQKTQVFFRGYSPVHFDGKAWGKKVGGGCFEETQPMASMGKEVEMIYGDRKRMMTVEKVVGEMKTRVKLLNVTGLSMYRKDAHVSMHNSKYKSMVNKNDYSNADCSHWCLPGLPDVWNHLLYALII